MSIRTFWNWLKEQPRVPAADQIIPLITAAGPSGITRADLGDRLRLDRATLDQLLGAMIEMGQISMWGSGGKAVLKIGQ